MGSEIKYGLLQPDSEGEYLTATDVANALRWCLRGDIEENVKFLINQIDGRTDYPIIKYNGGRRALLCSGCRVILDEDFEADKYKNKSAQYCDICGRSGL